MIKKVELIRFKKYKSQSFSLKPSGVTLLVGGNNAGKSTLIHALSVWEFCKLILLHEKGRSFLSESSIGKGDGLGMSSEEFLPIAVPSLNHLWTNLKTQLSQEEKATWPDQYPGYIMRIKCIWDYKEKTDQMLEIGLSLVNDRLFIRATNSNLSDEDYIPNIVYLPTFAGVLPRENKTTIAERRAFLGRGMAGSIIRNMIYDLYVSDKDLRNTLLQGKAHLSAKDKETLKQKSPLEKLQNNLRSTFCSELEIDPFNESFHTVIRISERKLVPDENGVLTVLPKTKYSPRDIITQGSGYLQWLSIFCILYTPEIDVLLLDEPDAHLHASLQRELLEELNNAIKEDANKQILVSTHSVEIIKQAELNAIFSMDSRTYLSEESSRVATLSGIGSEYFPKIDLLKRYKRLIFTENESDEKILRILGEKCNIQIPEDIVFWHNTDSHSDRRHVFNELHKIIPELKCISLRDRDMDNIDAVEDDLTFKGISVPTDSPIILLEWRRKNIESYLLCPKAIAEVAEQDINVIKTHLRIKFALAIEDDGYTCANPPELVLTLDGKHIFTNNEEGLEQKYHCNKYDVAKHMNSDQVCDDVKTFLTRVQVFLH